MTLKTDGQQSCGNRHRLYYFKDGYILTNAHVVSDAKAVWITLHDSTKVKAELIGSDVGTDIAVLKISVNKELLPLPIGDSSTVKQAISCLQSVTRRARN